MEPLFRMSPPLSICEIGWVPNCRMQSGSSRKTPSRIYLINATIAQHNRFSEAVYGAEHIHGRGNSRSLIIELIRMRDSLYTPEVARLAFGAMMRNFIDLVGEGFRRILRATANVFGENHWPSILCCRERLELRYGRPLTVSI